MYPQSNITFVVYLVIKKAEYVTHEAFELI